MLVQICGKCCSQQCQRGLQRGTGRGAHQGHSPRHQQHRHAASTKPCRHKQRCTDVTAPATSAFAGVAKQARIRVRDVFTPRCRGAEAAKLEQFSSSSLVSLNYLTKLISSVLPRSADTGCRGMFPRHIQTSTLKTLRAKSTAFSPCPPHALMPDEGKSPTVTPTRVT